MYQVWCSCNPADRGDASLASVQRTMAERSFPLFRGSSDASLQVAVGIASVDCVTALDSHVLVTCWPVLFCWTAFDVSVFVLFKAGGTFSWLTDFLLWLVSTLPVQCRPRCTTDVRCWCERCAECDILQYDVIANTSTYANMLHSFRWSASAGSAVQCRNVVVVVSRRWVSTWLLVTLMLSANPSNCTLCGFLSVVTSCCFLIITCIIKLT